MSQGCRGCRTSPGAAEGLAGEPADQDVVLGDRRAFSPKLVTTPYSKHQSAPDQHGQSVEHGPRRVWGGVELRNARETVKKTIIIIIMWKLPCRGCG